MHGFITLIGGILYPYETNDVLWRHVFIKFIYVQWFCFVLASLFVVLPLIKKGIKEHLKPNEKFIATVFWGNALILASYVSAVFNAFKGAYIMGAVSFSFVLYLIILVLLYRKKTDDLFIYEPVKYNQKKIQGDEATPLIQRLEQCVIEKEAYKNPDLKLHDLAQMMQISGHQLSQLLNDNLGKSFSSYINEYRIKKACDMIATDDRFTLEAIGYEVGFNSKSTFFATFKKVVGATPLAYKESLAIKNA